MGEPFQSPLNQVCFKKGRRNNMFVANMLLWALILVVVGRGISSATTLHEPYNYTDVGMWEGDFWIPPGGKIYNMTEMFAIMENRNVLVLGDSLGRRMAVTVAFLLGKHMSNSDLPTTEIEEIAAKSFSFISKQKKYTFTVPTKGLAYEWRPTVYDLEKSCKNNLLEDFADITDVIVDIGIHDAELETHWKSPYDCQYYLDHNIDLISAFGKNCSEATTAWEAYNHWNSQGRDEGRIASEPVPSSETKEQVTANRYNHFVTRIKQTIECLVHTEKEHGQGQGQQKRRVFWRTAPFASFKADVKETQIVAEETHLFNEAARFACGHFVRCILVDAERLLKNKSLGPQRTGMEGDSPEHFGDLPRMAMIQLMLRAMQLTPFTSTAPLAAVSSIEDAASGVG